VETTKFTIKTKRNASNLVINLAD